MLIFEDRVDAGQRLGQALVKYNEALDTIVLGLARGGVPVAFEIAKKLNLPLDVLCPRKIGAPMNPEFAIGAITETGEGIFDENTIRQLGITKEYIEATVAQEKEQAERRIQVYRSGMPPPDLTNKTAIIVDDGLATGATMKAAIRSVKGQGANQVVVAVPVSPIDTLQEMQDLANEIICLETPPFFQAIGQFYTDFSATSDEEVIVLLKD